MDFLTEIIARKRKRLAEAKESRSMEELRAEAFRLRATSSPHALLAALEDEARLNVIAEIKRASPSKGVINESINAAELARAYEAGGACAVSVLTEEDSFRGSLEDLREVRASINLPVLRKDFIFDEYQLYEAASAGADALLLIVAALDNARLEHLRHITEVELRMDALIEVHSVEELRRAAGCGARLVGVNNRSLRTFEVSLNVSEELSNFAPTGALMVTESGLRTREDLKRLHALGYHGFLIGEAFMRAQDPAEALRALIS